MKRLLLDVNVVLDVLLERAPHQAQAAALWAAIEVGKGRGVLSAHAVTTIRYLVQHRRGPRVARHAVEVLLGVFEVAPVDLGVLRSALGLGWPDLEDAVSAAAAAANACDAIVTRDVRGFRTAPLRIMGPEMALAWRTIESS